MSAFTDIVERLRAIVFRRREERELEEELRFHVDMEAEHQRRFGATETESRRRGMLALGGVERTKEEVRDARGTRLFQDSASDVSFALRTLSRSPGFAIVAVLTLAIGIGGTTAVFSAIDAVLLEPLPYVQPGQLVRLYQNDVGHRSDRGFVTPVHYLDYRSRMQSFSATAALRTYSETGADVGSGSEVSRIRVLPVSADYFDVVRVHPALGHTFDRGDERGASLVILSRALFERQLHGDAQAIGRALTMNGKAYTVAGVMPDAFADPVIGAVDALVPMDLRDGLDAGNADNHFVTIIARLRPGVTITEAQTELDRVDLALANQYPSAKDSRSILFPLKDDIVGDSSRALQIMLGAVALVLVLVCVNLANLMLVRASERSREFALRSALGAERGRLVRQMLIESLLLALAGDVAGLVVARVAMTAIVRLGSSSIPRLGTLALEPRLLIFSLVIATLSAIGFGLAPALRAARADPSDALREQSRSSTGGRAQLRLRDGLVVAQVALAFVLLVGAGLLLASVRRIGQVDLGVRPAAALTFELHLPDARYDSIARGRFYERVAKELEALPGVRAAGGVSKLPATGPFHQWGTRAVTGPEAHAERGTSAQQRVVSGDYFAAAGIPLVDGRLFDARDDAGTPRHVIVSRSMATRLFHTEHAVGQQLRAGGRLAEIVGVVGDVAVDALGGADRYVYHAHLQFAGDRNWELTQVVRSDGSLDALQRAARRAIADLDPQLVMFKPRPLADAIGQGEARREFTLSLLATFALVALALSALGLFGVLSYGVRLRSREFGIRMALGAERGAIRRMVMRQGLAVTAGGIAVGLVGALGAARLMQAMVFRVSPLDPFVLAGAAAFMSVVAAIAAYLPARRATTVDPRSALQ